MIWGHTARADVQPLTRNQRGQPPCSARNPLLLFEPRPLSSWPFTGRELAPQLGQHAQARVHLDRVALAVMES